jgi:ribosome recycling factor
MLFNGNNGHANALKCYVYNKNWMEGIKKAMNERNLSLGQWEDGKKWNLCVGQRRKTF